MSSRGGALRPRPARALVAAVTALAALSSCGSAERQLSHPFWLRATRELRARLVFDDGQAAAPEIPNVIARIDTAGQVVRTSASSLAGMVWRLELRRDDGVTVSLHYRLGDGARIELPVGAHLRVRVLRRPHGDDDGEDAGLLIWQRAAAARDEPGAAEALVVIATTSGIVEPAELPPSLRAIVPRRDAVYHETTLRDACEETYAQQWFAIGRGSDIVRVQGRQHEADPRQVAPGSRVWLQDARDTFEVLLARNRTTVRSACRVAAEASWSWVARRSAQRSAPVAADRAPVAPAGASPR